tara:strand:- start:56 stop:997 length:942 start_codon:yes stop_codon:yes gene_type:complete
MLTNNKFYSFISLYALSFYLLPKQDKLFFLYTVKNIDYLIWLSKLNFQLFVPGIYAKYQFGALGFLIFYPFLALFDRNWKEKYGLTGELYEFPFILERDRANNYQVCKNVQSKYYWYTTFTKHDISTPKVYYYNDKLINEFANEKMTYIKKPEYGGEGAGIEKISLEEYRNTEYDHSVILQEYLKDCHSKSARGVRVFTYCENKKARNYYIWFDTQTTDDFRTQAHHKTTRVFCDLERCEELTVKENDFIGDLTPKLRKLHEEEFHIIPIMSWDMILTCDDAYVFEGNMCPTKTKSKDEELLHKFKGDLSKQL